MNTHVPDNIKEKYFNFEFRGKPWEEKNRTLIEAINHHTNLKYYYSFDEDFFWFANCEIPTWFINKSNLWKKSL